MVRDRSLLNSQQQHGRLRRAALVVSRLMHNRRVHDGGLDPQGKALVGAGEHVASGLWASHDHWRRRRDHPRLGPGDGGEAGRLTHGVTLLIGQGRRERNDGCSSPRRYRRRRRWRQLQRWRRGGNVAQDSLEEGVLTIHASLQGAQSGHRGPRSRPRRSWRRSRPRRSRGRNR
jgi:hypothetical protein